MGKDIVFDAAQLEQEYDYETDQETIELNRKFLNQDLFHAVEFFVKECPLTLVDNLTAYRF